MKKNIPLILICATAFSIWASAQTLSFEPNDTIIIDMQYDQFVKTGPFIYNLTSDSLDIHWDRISNTLPSGWDYSLCDFGTCYVGIPTKGDMKKMSTTDSAFMKLNISPMSIAGTGSVTFRLEAPTGSGQFDTVTFIVNAMYPLTVAEKNSSANFSISPNPASDFIAIDFSNNTNEKSKIIITNILGETVKEENLLNEKKNILSTTHLQEGIYFLSLQQNEQVTETKKIIISR